MLARTSSLMSMTEAGLSGTAARSSFDNEE
jgi:hypothetical protein